MSDIRTLFEIIQQLIDLCLQEIKVPHCIIEHSPEVEGNILVPLVHGGVLESNLFEPDGSDIKVRAVSYSNHLTGSVNLNFIHVTVKTLSGRSLEQKTQLSHLVLEKLQTLSMSNCSITVEVDDIERDSYAKVIV